MAFPPFPPPSPNTGPINHFSLDQSTPPSSGGFGGGTVQLPNVPNPDANLATSARVRNGKPFLFQITDPRNQPVWPFMLALHVGPSKLSEKMSKSKTVAMTYGGFVEWVWPEELDTISADASTGAFLNPDIGLSAGSDNGMGLPGSAGRHGSMAWERQEDLLELFRNNGIIYDGMGAPAIRGHVMCMYDRGIYTGLFTTFEVREDSDHAFSFQLAWEFKVESVVYLFPFVNNGPSLIGADGTQSDQALASTQRGFESGRF